MNLGLYFDGDKVFVTESKNNSEKVDILKSYYINSSDSKLDIDEIAEKLEGKINRRRFNNLDITLPSDKFIINYIQADNDFSGSEVDIYENGKTSEDYVSKRLYTRGLETELMMNVQLSKEKIKIFFRLATYLGLKPRTLTPYFTKLSSNKVNNKVNDIAEKQREFQERSISVAYFDDRGVDLIFLYEGKLSFFKRINYDQNISIFIDTLKYYISSCKSNGKFSIYYYGIENEEYLSAVKRMNMDIVVKPLKMPSSIDSAGSYNSMISSL